MALSKYTKNKQLRTFEQNKVIGDSIHETFLLVIKGTIQDPINIFNMFLAFDKELSEVGQVFAGLHMTATPAHWKLSENQLKDIRHFSKIFKAIRLKKCTLVPPSSF